MAMTPRRAVVVAASATCSPNHAPRPTLNTDASNPTRVRPRSTRRDEDHCGPRQTSRANAPARPLAARFEGGTKGPALHGEGVATETPAIHLGFRFQPLLDIPACLASLSFGRLEDDWRGRRGEFARSSVAWNH